MISKSRGSKACGLLNEPMAASIRKQPIPALPLYRVKIVSVRRKIAIACAKAYKSFRRCVGTATFKKRFFFPPSNRV